MNITIEAVDGGVYEIKAESRHGEASLVTSPGDGITEYVAQHNRLQRTYIEYCLGEVKKPSKAQKEFLAFIQRGDDGFRPQRVRKPGWDKDVSDGVNRKGQSGRPGDVRVIGSPPATTTLKVGVGGTSNG